MEITVSVYQNDCLGKRKVENGDMRIKKERERESGGWELGVYIKKKKNCERT